MEGRFTVEKMVCNELGRLGTIVSRRLCCTFDLAKVQLVGENPAKEVRVRLTMKKINAC